MTKGKLPKTEKEWKKVLKSDEFNILRKKGTEPPFTGKLLNNKEKGAVVCAHRSHYNKSVIEVISSVYLRDKLKLKDGNKVKVEVFPYKPKELSNLKSTV